MIDPRDGFINDPTNAALRQICIEFLKQLDDVCRRDIDIHEQTAVGQALVGVESGVHNIGRQDGVQMIPHEEHKRMVFETVAVVVHIVAEEQECCIACFRHILVPQRFISRGVSPYLEHLL